jgi:Lar family restriction alleviation protein
MADATLLPCPFCGSADVKFSAAPFPWFVTCHECSADGPSGDTRKAATDNWNARAALTALQVTEGDKS